MSFVTRTLTEAAIGVGVADEAAALSVLKKPGCAAAILRRRVPPDLQAGVDRIAPEQLPRGRISLRPSAVAQAVDQLCDLAGTPPGAERAYLRTDIAGMAQIFAELMSVSYLKLRLDVVTGDACRRFHIDAVTARLVCTYRGPGTQYGISTDGEAPTRVFQVATGAPIVLRGTLWPEDPPSGILHRSPPIEGTGETRLVLVLDPLSEPEDLE